MPLLDTALVSADWHLASNPRDAYRHTWQKWFLRTVKNLAPRQVIVLGDITEQKNCHDAELVNQIVGYLCTLANNCDELIIMRGNHDGTNPEEPFFRFIEHIANVRWINHPTAIALEGLGNCLFLPHTRNHEKDWADISFAPFKRDPKRCGFVFAHNTFDGALIAPGRTMRGIPLSVFPKGCPVISGDVHVPQTLGPVTYVGAPYTIDFGDHYEPRVLQLALTPAREVQWQSIPCTGVQKRLLVGKSVAEISKVAFSSKFNEGDILKVRIDWTGMDMSGWSAMRKAVQLWADEKGYVLYAIEPIISASQRRSIKYKPNVQISDRELLAQYCKRHKISEAMQKTGKLILQE